MIALNILIFWDNVEFFWLAKSEKFAKKIKFSPNMIMTNQKGPVKSIKKQKYIQIVGNISLQHVQEQI